jgi:anti-sigma regulatory factor (Ser/Thr protein kinase)
MVGLLNIITGKFSCPTVGIWGTGNREGRQINSAGLPVRAKREGEILAVITDFVIPARFEAIPDISLEIEHFMHNAGFSDQQVLDMQLAIEEAVTNTISHGYRGSTGSISIHCEAGDDRLTVMITDDAPAFDPLSVPDPDISSSIGERRTGGLGIYLIRRVTDAVEYRYEQGKNILVLIKKK